MRRLAIVAALGVALSALGARAQSAATLDPFVVSTDRFEELGLSVHDFLPTARRTPTGNRVLGLIDGITPHTAAAKAGLKPGEKLLRADGHTVAVSVLRDRDKWSQLVGDKNREARAGKKVQWVLEVESADGKATRTVTLALPTPPPHWGASTWQAPMDRPPAAVTESGPLAERAATVLNNGIWSAFDASLAPALGLPATPEQPLLGCYWDITVDGPGRRRMLHRIFVTQQRGRTEIVLHVRSAIDRSVPEKWLLTSPAGELIKAHGYWDKKLTGGKARAGEIPAAEAAADLQAEASFWLRRVGQASPRWPLELLRE